MKINILSIVQEEIMNYMNLYTRNIGSITILVLSLSCTTLYGGGDKEDKYYSLFPGLSGDRWKAEDFDNASVGKIAQRGLKKGFQNGVDSITKNSTSALLGYIPNTFKSIAGVIGAVLYKASYGTRGLSWNELAIMSNRIYHVTQPFITKSLSSTIRDKRATEISHEMNNDFSDPHWESQQKKITKELTHAIATLTRVLPVYNLAFHSNKAGIKRTLATWINSMSSQNKEQISYCIITAINDLAVMRNYFNNFKSFKEAEQNIEYIRRWLTWICGTFETIALLLEGDAVNPRAAGKVLFQKVGAIAMQTTQNQMTDLFGSANGSNLNI
jgi:hypothetical protein